MKIKFFFLFLLGVILYSSCQEDKFDLDSSILLENSPLTRSITPQVSKVFDWEDTTKVMLLGHGLVTLPWYSGASTSIPDYILKDYKSADGWTMLYNFCSDPASAQVGAYYLMFYNYFTGIYRVYFYNVNNTTTAGTTLWRVSFDNECAFFTTQGNYTQPLNSPTIIPDMYISNISSLPAKSLTRGWNCFDFEMLYDPNVVNKSLRMNIGVYDIKTDSIKLMGMLSLDSEGTIITKVTSNPSSSFINKTATVAGKAAGDYIQKQIGKNESRVGSGIIAAGVSELVKAGVNLLGKSFLGKNSKTNISTQDLRIQTKGEVDLNGQITNVQQSNILPIANIKVPGAKSFIEDNYLPAFDSPLGVWNLSSAPVAEISDLGTLELVEVGGIYDSQFTVTLRCKRHIFLNKESVRSLVKINPILLPMIEKYEVVAELCCDWQYARGSREATYYGGHNVSFDSNICWGITFWQQDRSVLKNSQIAIRLRREFIMNLNITDLTPLYPCYIKVTVILYPKAPYDTREIYSTKTFRPEFRLRKEYVK